MSCRKWLRRGVVTMFVLVVLWLLGAVVGTYWHTRRPLAPFAEPAPAFPHGRLEEHRLHTSDGEELGAWFLDGKPGRPAVLLLHGHRGHRGHSLEAAQVFAQAGCAVLLVSLRAHGDSSGDYNDYGYGARHDVAAAVAFLRQRCSAAPIIVRGVSMGAAAAVFAATAVRDDVAGWILESPYQDLRTALWNRLENYSPPPCPQVAYAGLSLTAPLFFEDVDRIAPLRAIDAIPETQPVLILAGDRDDRARPEEARRCSRASPRTANWCGFPRLATNL